MVFEGQGGGEGGWEGGVRVGAGGGGGWRSGRRCWSEVVMVVWTLRGRWRSAWRRASQWVWSVSRKEVVGGGWEGRMFVIWSRSEVISV